MPKISEFVESKYLLNPQKIGLVEWFAQDKGYGVIICPDIGEVFLHKSNIIDKELKPRYGKALFFEVEQLDSKRSGINIREPESLSELEFFFNNIKQTDNFS
ncbi:MAG TPA: cold shock domain-containing protein, partial [Balneolales bacterium]|nr:cold shock domain-containing protein [Balneolales bacterium]